MEKDRERGVETEKINERVRVCEREGGREREGERKRKRIQGGQMAIFRAILDKNDYF
jgi:hypothetical protein